MSSGTISEMSNYLQPDHFDSDKKNVNEFLGQNPLLLLARTCQNIGVETTKSQTTSTPASSSHSTDSMKMSNGSLKSTSSSLFSHSPPARAFSKIPPVTRPIGKPMHSPAYATTSSMTTVTHSPPVTQAVHHPNPTSSTDEADLYIPPSSNSLIQLARLSSSLKLPSAGDNRQKRTKPSDQKYPPNGIPGASSPRAHKRARRQSFGRPSSTSKPIDFSSHFSSGHSHSSPPSTSSSVSPSSLRSTPPTHTSPPPNSASIEMMKTLIGLQSASSAPSTNPLETFYNVGSMLGASPDRLRDLLMTVAGSLVEKGSEPPATTYEPPQPAKQPPVSDPSTQCLYCGHVCADMGNLVQHIYTHLASLHKQHNDAPPVTPSLPPVPPTAPQTIATNQSLFDLAACYARFLQRGVDTAPLPAPVQPPPPPPPPPTTTSISDPNALFMAWLNVFRPAYGGEAMTSSNN